MIESKEELQKILNDFWLLDVNEYSIIKDLIKDEIERYEEKISKGEYQEDRYYYQDKRMRDFYVVMKEKIDYIISKGLHKKYES